MNKKKIGVIGISFLLGGTAAFFINLFCLAQYDYPKIRGNHVGLSMLSLLLIGSFSYFIQKKLFLQLKEK